MPARILSAVFVLALCARAASPLPELRIEATAGGSILYVKNAAAQPLTAFLIELVDYPGSAYAYWHDDVAAPIAPGTEKRIPITNMTVGAVPDYVKMQSAVYADGSTSGIDAKVTQLVERRRFALGITRELIRRLEKAGAGDRTALVTDLRQWSDSLPPEGRAQRNSQAVINQGMGRVLIGESAARLQSGGVEQELGKLRAAEQALASSKPPL